MPSVMLNLTSMFLLARESGGILESLPDPMKPTLLEIGFVVGLLAVLYFFLKYMFFHPLGKLMDGREAEIQAGASVKADVAKAVDARQAEYSQKLKGLRAKAFEYRKTLAQAAAAEKANLVEKARLDAVSMRQDATNKLVAQRETAKSELIAQVDALADSMVQHMLKQV